MIKSKFVKLFTLGLILVVLGGLIIIYILNNSKHTTSTKQAYSKIFNNVASELKLNKSSLIYFRFYKTNKVQYSYGPGTNYAYLSNGRWHIAGPINQQSVQSCSDYHNVPSQFMPDC